MADTITEWQRRQFNSNVIYCMQQVQSLVVPNLDPMNVHLGVKGNLDDFDIVGSMVHHDLTDRHGDTQVGSVEHGRVWCRPYPSDAVLYLDREDKVRSAIEDPNSAHTRTIAMSLIRAKDKRLLDAARAAALIGETASSTVAFDTANQQIALDTTPNDVLTLAKIKTASVKLTDAAFPIGEGERFFYYAPGQLPAILAITQAASSDFTAQRIYDSGDINGKFWMGFKWVCIPDVKTQSSTGTISTLLRMLNLSSTTRSCLAVGRAALGYSETQGISTFLDVLPQKQHLTQARAVVDCNGVRVMQNGVVEILAKEETA